MIDKKLTQHLADLSKINFTDEELEKITVQMGDIINLMDKVKEIDSNNPTYTIEAVNYEDLRADEVAESSPNEDILKNSKETKENSFVVPKVV